MNLPALKTTSAGPRQRWYFMTRRPGRDYPERIYLGLTSQMNKKEALSARAQKYAEIKTAPEERIADVMTVSSFIDTVYTPEALTEGGRKKRTTIEHYRWVINNHIRPFFGPMKIGEVRVFDVNRWLRELKPNNSYFTMAAYRGILSGIFAKAETHDIILKNPVKRSEIPAEREGKRVKRVFSKEDLDRVCKALPSLSLMMRLGVSTGLRISEILGLRWDNVDLINGTLTVRERFYRRDIDTPKNMAVRGKVMPLGQLLDDMRRQRAATGDSQYVFPSPSTNLPLSYSGVHTTLRDTMKELGLWTPGFSFHSLRRTYISALNEDNTNAVETAAAVGKASVQSLLEYQVLSPERHAELVERVQTRMLGKTQ